MLRAFVLLMDESCRRGGSAVGVEPLRPWTALPSATAFPLGAGGVAPGAAAKVGGCGFKGMKVFGQSSALWGEDGFSFGGPCGGRGQVTALRRARRCGQLWSVGCWIFWGGKTRPWGQCRWSEMAGKVQWSDWAGGGLYHPVPEKASFCGPPSSGWEMPPGIAGMGAPPCSRGWWFVALMAYILPQRSEFGTLLCIQLSYS